MEGQVFNVASLEMRLSSRPASVQFYVDRRLQARNRLEHDLQELFRPKGTRSCYKYLYSCIHYDKPRQALPA